LKVEADPSFSEWVVTRVASTSRTTVSPRSVPATFEAGSPPGSRDQTWARTFARARSIRLAIAGVIPFRARHTVGAEATEPSTSR